MQSTPATTVASTPMSPRSPLSPRSSSHRGSPRKKGTKDWMKVRRVNQERPESGGSDSSGLPGEGFVIGGRRVERKHMDDGSYGKRGEGSAHFVWELLKRLASQKDQAGNIELFRVLDNDGSGKTDADEILTSLKERRNIQLDPDEIEVFCEQVRAMDADRDGEVDVGEFIGALQGEDTTGAYFGVLERRAVEGLVKHQAGQVKTWPSQGRQCNAPVKERLAARWSRHTPLRSPAAPNPKC